VDASVATAVGVDGGHDPEVGTVCEGCGVDVPDASALTNKATIAITVMMTIQRTVFAFIRYQRTEDRLVNPSAKVLPVGPPQQWRRGADTSSMSTETVCIVKDPGLSEERVQAMAWDRLRIRGLAPASRPYRSELIPLSNDAVQVWQVSFLVNAR
jgi:hypothetical protein